MLQKKNSSKTLTSKQYLSFALIAASNWLGKIYGCYPLCQRFRKFRSEIKWKGPFRFLPTGIFGTTSGGGPLISVGIFRPKFAVPFTEFLFPSTALLSLAWSIMADFGSMQASSHYQCSVCSYTTTDLSQLLMHSCSAMTGMYLSSGYTKICQKVHCFVVLYFKKS